MTAALIVPTHTHPSTLDQLLDRAGMPTIIIHTTETTADIPGATNLRDLGPTNIHRWWNAGIREAECQGHDIAVICNHDTVPADKRQLTELADQTRDSDATLGIPNVDARNGWCYALNLTHRLRAPEQYRWWYGDDWMYAEAKRIHNGVTVADIRVEHDRTGSRTEHEPRIRQLIVRDRREWSRYQKLHTPVTRPTTTKRPTVTVVIPWRDTGCPQRARNLAETRKWFARLSWPVILGDSDHPDFNRSAARNRGVQQTTTDIVVLCDADVRPDHQKLREAVTRAANGGGLIHPYRRVIYLNEDGTQQLIANKAISPTNIHHSSGNSPGGCSVFRRTDWQPFDENYVGWGHEDIDWTNRMRATVGQTWLPARAHHMWHPPAIRDERTKANHTRLYSVGNPTETVLPDGTLDVVYRVRPGDNNDELRYSLRSLANLPHRYVWIVGHKPLWVTDDARHVRGNIHKSKWENVFDNVRIACEQPDITDPFVLFDDDMYVMQPVAAIPNLYRGTLAGHIADTESTGTWLESLDNTLNWLQANGNPDPLSYELHVPYVVHKQQMLKVLELARDWSWPNPPQLRSLDGNYWQRGGTIAPDVKVMRGKTPTWDTLLSTSDGTLKTVLHELRKAFPKPCRYEINP